MGLINPLQTGKSGKYSSQGFRKAAQQRGESAPEDLLDRVEAVKDQLMQQIPEQEILTGLMAYDGYPEETAREIIEKAKAVEVPEEPAEADFGVGQPIVQRPWTIE